MSSDCEQLTHNASLTVINGHLMFMPCIICYINKNMLLLVMPKHFFYKLKPHNVMIHTSFAKCV
jgi:hypothetical protein